MEVLISLVLTAITTTALLKIYLNQHENYLAQDDITQVQQGARAAIDEITRQVRMAGHQLPPAIEPIIASNTNPDTSDR